MLKGISPLISPELLAVLCRMGHGDEIVLADAHFPGDSSNTNVIRADGLLVTDLLEAIMPLFELDQYVDDPVIMMAPVSGDSLDPNVEQSYEAVLKANSSVFSSITQIERAEFYQRAKGAFAVVMTGETRKYGNVILKKGVTAV
jgi:L-fucose mutarotase